MRDVPRYVAALDVSCPITAPPSRKATHAGSRRQSGHRDRRRARSGRGYALAMAEAGAKVVVNDLGGSGRGEGAEPLGRHEVVARSSAIAAAKRSPTSTTSPTSTAHANMVQQAVDTFGGLDVLVNNAGILRDRMIFNMDEDGLGRGGQGPPRGHFAPSRHACAYWRDRAKEIDGPVHGRSSAPAPSSGSRGTSGRRTTPPRRAGSRCSRSHSRSRWSATACGRTAWRRPGTTRLITMTQGAGERKPLEPDQYTEFDPHGSRQRRATRRLARVRPVTARDRSGVPLDRPVDHPLPPVDAERTVTVPGGTASGCRRRSASR